ncbi:sigma-54-dependent transcriptional regulator [Peredibacter starrii]|uniref:Sigma-54 dependent transcriptional regulator n=1 Tax=Peredibacter starrii TaxID=28202 RepID=A0AAX4HRN9_9BACT|nr:sigma-54 dependent transcriptional regulator [Peredibacter starrii]WPU65778.1 sigma-54 dependent transcriptional regulator [Peredibacter starrii]
MKSHLSFLIIEDDKYARLNLREILQPFGIIEEAEDIKSAREKLAIRPYDIVLTDIELGEGSGVDLISEIVKKGSHCIVVSSYEGDETIEKAYTLGAKHYLSKFKLKDQLPVYIQKFIQAKQAKFEKILKDEFITQDEDLISEFKKLAEINWKNQTLFISGPTGTGKSLLGKLIHEITHPEANLVHLNCSEVAENLLESELFGHEKGAFTGADQKKDGKLKLAHGGTLFLDEVATMPMAMQQKLLKALDEKTFYPVGSSTPVKADFTLITATCEDLKDKMAKKEFREDFFHRISGFQFHLKSLSERPNDIDLLLRHFQALSPRRYVIKPDAIQLLKKHAWPGNIRELRKTCERFSQGGSGIIDSQIVSKMLGLETKFQSSQEEWEEHVFQHGLKSYINMIERKAVEEAMKRNNGKITACIKDLKISSSAFYRILQENKLQF